MTKKEIIEESKNDLDIIKVYLYKNKKTKTNYIIDISDCNLEIPEEEISFFHFFPGEARAIISEDEYKRLKLPKGAGKWSDYKLIYSRFESKFNETEHFFEKIDILHEKLMNKTDFKSYCSSFIDISGYLYKEYLNCLSSATGKSYYKIEKELEKQMEKTCKN